MSEQDRKRRLGDASNLEQAIRSLGKVSEEHRITFVHDRLMSAIDDICKSQKNNTAKFTPSQIIVLKDIAFQMVYILDPRNQTRAGFFRRLMVDFKEQSPLKQVGLFAGSLATIAAAVAGIWSGYQQIKPWLDPPPIKKTDKAAPPPSKFESLQQLTNPVGGIANAPTTAPGLNPLSIPPLKPGNPAGSK